MRECIHEAPAAWITDRASKVMERMLGAHGKHSSTGFHEVVPCPTCHGNLGSWKAMAEGMYGGDPFSFKATFMPYVEPEFFRPGSGTYGGGKPTW